MSVVEKWFVFLTLTALLIVAGVGLTGAENFKIDSGERELYEVTEIDLGLNFLEGEDGYVRAINNNGEIVGWVNVGDWGQQRETKPFVWKDGRLEFLEFLPGNDSGIATGINDAGVITGWSGVGFDLHAVRWIDGEIEDLGRLVGLGGSTHFSDDVNKKGFIVGESGGKAFVWNPETKEIVDLGALSTSSKAIAINDDSVIVGSSRTDRGINYHAVRWVDGVIESLGTLRTFNGSLLSSVARDVNKHGVIVGHSDYNPNINFEHAFVWDPKTEEMTDLGTIDDRWGATSHALAINDYGVIVGTSQVEGSVDRHGFVWRNGKVHDLNDFIEYPGLTFVEADDINEHGQIIGFGLNTARETRLFLLTPE